MAEWGIVDIHGVPYHTVAKRVSDFRQDRTIADGWSIQTKILDHVPDTYVVVRAKVLNPEGKVVGTGHAYEKYDSMGRMGSAMLEVAETSAVGRALAMAGFAGTQSEIASADEMQRRAPESNLSKVKANKIMRAIVAAADKEDHWGVLEIWDELGEGDIELREQQRLWLMNNLDRVNVEKVNASLKIAQDAVNDKTDPNFIEPLPLKGSEKDRRREQVRAAK